MVATTMHPHRFTPENPMSPFCSACGKRDSQGEHVRKEPERAGRAGDSQGLPTPNSYPDIQSQAIADIQKRRELGISRYGTALQPFNGRDALMDLYEELIDAMMYAKQRIVERELAIADHDHDDCMRAVGSALNQVEVDIDPSDVHAFLSFLAEEGFVILRQEHV